MIISVVIPTYNSEKTLEKTLKSIREQSFNQEEIEILIIDGGSTDNTLEIANRYGCIILKNEKKLPEFAKNIGIRNAAGKYICNLDSDEVIENKDSFRKKIEFLENSDAKNILSSGLKTPNNNIFTDYTNSFGDPFSFFIYKISGFGYVKSLISNKYRYEQIGDFKKFYIDNKITPICDGGGSVYDVAFLKQITDINVDNISASVFDKMTEKTNCFVIMNDDYITHYTSASFSILLRKIRFRVINNIFNKKETPGFANREARIPKIKKIKKYLFIPFSLLVLPVLIFSIINAVKYKKYYFIWLNTILAVYTALIILWFYILKIFKINIKLDKY